MTISRTQLRREDPEHTNSFLRTRVTGTWKERKKGGRKAAGLMHYCRRLQGAWAVTQVFTRNESWFPALVDSLANIGYHQHFTTERETNFAPSSHKKVVSSFTLFEDTGLRHLAPDKYINPRDPLTQAAGRTTAPVKMRVADERREPTPPQNLEPRFRNLYHFLWR